MVANPEKFKFIIITKDRQDTSEINFEFSGKMIKPCTKVELLEISIDIAMKLTLIIMSLRYVVNLLAS